MYSFVNNGEDHIDQAVPDMIERAELKDLIDVNAFALKELNKAQAAVKDPTKFEFQDDPNASVVEQQLQTVF